MLLKDVASRVDTGLLASYKLAEAQVDEQERRLDLRKRKRQFDTAAASLLDLMGAGAQSPAALVDDAPPIYLHVLPRVGLAPLEIVTELALYESRGRSAKFDVPRAKGRFLPSVEVYFKQDLIRADLDSFSRAVGHMSRDKRFVGLTMRWNLFEGMDTVADIKQATLRSTTSEQDQRYAQYEQDKARRDRQNTLDGAKADLELEQERLALSGKRLALSQLRTELGRAEASSLSIDMIDHDLQALETRRREEQVSYLEAQQALAGDLL